MRAVVIGVGHLGKHHARILASLPGVSLAGVVDTGVMMWPGFKNRLIQVPRLLRLVPVTSIKVVSADLESDAGSGG